MDNPLILRLSCKNNILFNGVEDSDLRVCDDVVRTGIYQQGDGYQPDLATRDHTETLPLHDG